MSNSRNIMLMLFIVYGICVAVIFANSIGVPFTDAQLHHALIYWVHALIALTAIVLLLGLGVLMNMTMSMLTFLFGAILIWILAHIFIFVMLVLELVSCDTSIQCADNVVDLVFVGPYEGPSGTFLLNFIVTIIMLLLELIIAYMVYSQRQSARLSVAAECAAVANGGSGYYQPQQQQQQYYGQSYGQSGYVNASISDEKRRGGRQPILNYG